MERWSAPTWIGAAWIHALFGWLVLSGLAAPLFWYDESETAMHARRILEYGYPKVHEPRGNVVYAGRYPIALGVDESLDAYLGSPWGQYYFAAPGVAWSDRTDDLGEKTRRVRLPFALAGWLGVVWLGGAAASLWPRGAGTRAHFWLAFGACLVVSVSLQLHLREARYYPLVVLGVASVVGLEVRRHAWREPARLAHALLLTAVLWWTFNLFYPAFAALVTTAGGALALQALRSRAPLRARARELARGAAPYALASLAVLPLVAFYRLPEQTRAFALTFDAQGNPALERITAAAWYLVRFELLVPAAVAALALHLARRRAGPAGRELAALAACCHLALAGTLIWTAFAVTSPAFYERYLVALSPLLAAATALAAGGLVALRATPARRRTGSGLAAIGCALAVSFALRIPELSGRYAELHEPYRGPLDHVIPYLAARYAKPEELVIATNYEELAYMFYLGSRVTLGFYAPDRERDFAIVPDVIIPRPWSRNGRALERLAAQGRYLPHEFPVANLRVNNLPSLSENTSGLVHRFTSPVPGRDGPALVIRERERD